MPVSMRSLRAGADGARWALSVAGRTRLLRLPSEHAHDYAVATLNNAMCAFAPDRIDSVCAPAAEPVVAAAIAHLSGSAQRDGLGTLLRLAERIHGTPPAFSLHSEADSQSDLTDSIPLEHARSAPVDGLVIGLDIGGTDLKVVAMRGDEVVYSADPAWDLEPTAFTSGFEYLPVFREQIAAARAASKAPLAAIGVSFPDLCVDDEVIGGITSKTIGMRNRYGGFSPQYWAIFDATMRPLARELATEFDVPVRLVNDGVAAAAWAAVVSKRRSLLCLSLGTSVAGGSVTVDGRSAPLPLYAGAFAIRVDDTPESAHRTTGLTGAVQKYPCQTGLFRLLGEEPADPKTRLSELQQHPDASAEGAFADAGLALAQTVEECRFWLGADSVKAAMLFGRLTEDSPGTQILLDEARGHTDVPLLRASELPSPWPVDPQTLGQAVGAALIARGDA